MFDIKYKHTLLPLRQTLSKNKFLPHDTYLHSKWSGTDNKERFEENLKSQSPDWFYRTHSVAYTLNSSGYRAPEFKTIDWCNSVVMFGCSNVYGTGLDDEDTISNQLSKIIGHPVINMGSIGSSMAFALHNSVVLHDLCSTPAGVVYIWPSHNRCLEYRRNSVFHHGPWSMEENGFMDVLTRNPNHTEVSALLTQKIAKALWRGKTKLYEATFSDDSKFLNCETLQYLDVARDLWHPGRLSAIEAANKIAKGLNF